MPTGNYSVRRVVVLSIQPIGVARRELIPETIHDTSQYADNRALPNFGAWCLRVLEKGNDSVVQTERENFLAEWS
ncbi:MAG: hypothetical protein GQ577_06060 [Woeseiaceae bacterium]|nr:hypothetical protein [Woeseiaceae bacterium]